MTAGDAGRPLRPVDSAVVLAASAVGATVLGLLGMPAGVLIGAVLGSVVANRLLPGDGGVRELPTSVRVLGLVMLGCAAGVRLDGSTLATLGHIAVPLLVSVAALLVLDVLLAWVLVTRYDVDAMTAVIACAPGGLSAISITANEMGARMGVVLAIHTVRVLAVVLVVLPVLVAWLGAP